MCKPHIDIHFCTCASESKKPLPFGGDGEVNSADFEKARVIWTLYKYIGGKDILVMGDMVMPVESLDEELTTE